MIDFDYIVSLSKDENLDVIKSRSQPLEFWKEVVYAGTFKKGPQTVRVSPERMDHWRDQFVAMSSDGIQVPVPVEHTKNPERRRGTIVAMRRQKDSKGREALFARFRFRDNEAAKLALTTGSSIFVPREVPSASGKAFRDAIEHICVTDYPVVSDMDGFQPVVLSFAAAWDEDAHPRHGAGDSRGGEFAPKEGGDDDSTTVGDVVSQVNQKHRYMPIDDRMKQAKKLLGKGASKEILDAVRSQFEQDRARLRGDSVKVGDYTTPNWKFNESDKDDQGRMKIPKAIAEVGARLAMDLHRADNEVEYSRDKYVNATTSRKASDKKNLPGIKEVYDARVKQYREFTAKAEEFKAKHGIHPIAAHEAHHDEPWRFYRVGSSAGAKSKYVAFAWDESAHPRHEAGSSAGGEFAPKSGGSSTPEKNKMGREKTRDKNGNYITWTGRSTKPERTFGGRYSAQHSSASGWYVFDNFEDRVVADGLGSLKAATKRAKSEVKNPTALAWDPDDHPRHEPGDPRGGEFAPKMRRTTKEQADALHDERQAKGAVASKSVVDMERQPYTAARDSMKALGLKTNKAPAGARVDKKRSVVVKTLEKAGFVKSNADDDVWVKGDEHVSVHGGIGNRTFVHVYKGQKTYGEPPQLPQGLSRETKMPRKKERRGYYPTGVVALSRTDDMTLKELATQAGVDPEQPDDQIILALSRVIANTKGPAQTGAAPQMPMRPAYPMMAPAQAPAPRPFGMAHDDENDEHDEPVALSGSLLKMVKENRTMILDDLLAKGYIVPETRKTMVEKYLDEKVICFSHAPDFNDGFEDAVQLIKNNGRVLPTGRSGPQAGVVALSKTSGERDYLDEKVEALRKERGLN